MVSRVATSSLYTRLQHGLGSSLAEFQRLQTQAGSGQRIHKMSDDVVGATTGLRLRSQTSAYEAYNRTADDAASTLGVTDGALQTASALLRRAKELAIGAVNGAYGPTEQKVAAAELDSIRGQLIDIANTQHMGRAVFGGHQPTAFDREGVYVGDGGAVSRQVAPAVTVKVNLDGQALFERTLDRLTTLRDAVAGGQVENAADGSPGVISLQGDLETGFKAVTEALGTVGALANRVTAATSLNTNALDTITAERSKVEDVDLAETIMKMQAASAGYQAALAAVAKGDMPSLASFLR